MCVCDIFKKTLATPSNLTSPSFRCTHYTRSVVEDIICIVSCIVNTERSVGKAVLYLCRVFPRMTVTIISPIVQSTVGKLNTNEIQTL